MWHFVPTSNYKISNVFVALLLGYSLEIFSTLSHSTAMNMWSPFYSSCPCQKHELSLTPLLMIISTGLEMEGKVVNLTSIYLPDIFIMNFRLTHITIHKIIQQLPMQATVHGVTKSWTWLNNWAQHSTCSHNKIYSFIWHKHHSWLRPCLPL